MKSYAVLLILTVMFSLSCSDSEEPVPYETNTLQEPQVNAQAPPDATVTLQGTFASFAHSLAGDVTLHVDAQGTRTLRFENFTMTQGPDVYVLFSKSNNYSKANTIALAMLKEQYSNTSVNFEVDKSLDLTTHKFVLVYCVQFSSLFGYLELK